jgi:hypothetical protein
VNEVAPPLLASFGVWHEFSNGLAEGWVAAPPIQSRRGLLPMVAYLGGPVLHGHTDAPPLALAPALARSLASEWAGLYPGTYEARVLPVHLIDHEACDGHRCLRCAIEHHGQALGPAGRPLEGPVSELPQTLRVVVRADTGALYSVELPTARVLGALFDALGDEKTTLVLRAWANGDGARLTVERVRPGPTVHVLHQGLASCGFTRELPSNWPAEHSWVGRADGAVGVTCADCLRIARGHP